MRSCIVFGVRVDADTVSWPGRNQLMHALAEHCPVVFLRQTPLRCAVVGAKPSIGEIGPNTFAVDGAFQLRYHRLGRRLAPVASSIDGRWYQAALRRLGFDHPVMWLTTNDSSLVRRAGHPALVYDCMDPNFLPLNQAAFDRSERALARRADVVFASAQALHARMASVNPRTFLLPNACAEADLAGSAERTRPPGDPVVGYLGTIDWRFDPDPVIAAARTLPGVRFVIAGRVNPDQESRIAGLRALPNVHMPGQLDIEEGAACVRTFDVGLIPFRPGPIGDTINPVKMHMYLARGLPVVSTWVAECRLNPHVSAAETNEAFARAVADALAQDTPAGRQTRIATAASNTWRSRAEQAMNVLGRHGVLNPTSRQTAMAR